MALLLVLTATYYAGFSVHSAEATTLSRSAFDTVSTPQDPVLCPDQRSVWDILWSCVSTVFICSWVAVHPDIPAPGENQWRLFCCRVEYMLWTIITPELMIYWAARQWFGARAILDGSQCQRDVRRLIVEHNWTRTHAHFLQMGGFTLYDSDGQKRKGVLSLNRLSLLVAANRVRFPQITLEEIMDRSKSDGLSKLLAIGQTTWFICATISRGVQGLTVTELEIATAAFAALNATMYFFWWDKPFDVRTSLPVYLLPETREVGVGYTDSISERPQLDFSSSLVRHPVEDAFVPIFFPVERVMVPWDADSVSLDSVSNNAPAFFIPEPTYSVPPPKKSMTVFSTLLWPFILASTFVSRRLHAITEDFRESYSFANEDEEAISVPPFYALITPPKNEKKTNAYTAFIGITFGAIHTACWNFTFPTDFEHTLWRIGSLIIVGVPLIFLILIGIVEGRLKVINFKRSKRNLIRVNTPLITRVLFPLYGLARLIILLEALITLRRLPDGALDVVVWMSFIPHI